MKLLLLSIVLLIGPIPSYGADGMCVRHISTPQYPPLARQARIEGSVVLNLDIAENGEVVSVVGSGHNMLRDAAEKNISQWVFCRSNAARNINMTFIYKIRGEEIYQPSPADVMFDLPEQVTITTRPPEPMP
jgi:TonB family protein